MLLHRFGVVYGHGRIEIVDLSAHGVGDGRRIAPDVDHKFISQERRVTSRALRKRTEKDVASVLAEGARFDVFDHANDLVGHSSARNALADGTLSSEEMLSKGPVDDGYFSGVRCFMAKVAACQPGDPHGFKITRRCHVQLHDWKGARGLRFAFHLEAIAPVSPGQRDIVGSGTRDHAWNGCDTLP